MRLYLPHSLTRSRRRLATVFLVFCISQAWSQSLDKRRDLLVSCGSIRVLAAHRTSLMKSGLEPYLPFVSPLRVSYRVTSSFGPRFHPVRKRWQQHNGIDLSCREGTPVRVTGHGVITFCGRRGGYGKCVIVRHALGFESLYGHLSHIHGHIGKRVRRGDVVGLSGSTGIATGPHLHYEIRKNGKATYPIII